MVLDKNDTPTTIAPTTIAALPAYNEEVYIGSMVLATRPYVNEVIVIDDGSSDRTAKFAFMAGARVIKHKVNLGKGKALQTILEEAKNLDVDILVLLDADCQHDPDEIPLLLEPIKKGDADIVNGSRFLNKRSKIPFYRRAGQHILTFSTNFSAGTSITDSQNGFRALSKKAIQSIKLTENGMGVESEMMYIANEFNLRIKEVPISCRYDVDGSTFNPVRHGISVIKSILHQLQRKHPLFYFGLPGFISVVLGGGLLLQMLFVYNASSQFWTGKTLMALVLILIGLGSLFTGLILNSIACMLKGIKSS